MARKDEYIKDWSTRQTIGILRTHVNGDVEAIEFSSRKTLGYYRAKKDITTDFYGRMIAHGNCVVSFIYDNFQKKKSVR